jgi:pimeloyl-ACP methyl ester carboxylesterase
VDRRAFVGILAAAAVANAPAHRADAQPAAKIRNIVLVHGLFADGSCWGGRIARLQAAGLNVRAVQNPLTTLDDAVAATQRVLEQQDGPTVLVGHSFAGAIVTEAGVHPNVASLVYVAARAPDAGEDYTALAKRFPTPRASAGIVWSGDSGQLTETAFLRDFAGDVPTAKARVLYAVQAPFNRTLTAGKTTHAAWRSKPSWYAVSTENHTIDPKSRTFHVKTHGRDDDRGESKPRFADLAARHDRPADPASRRANRKRAPNVRSKNDDLVTREEYRRDYRPRSLRPPMIVAATRPIPAQQPLGLGDREVVDARFAPAHQAVFVELPHFVSITAEPPCRRIVTLVGEAHGDPVLAKAPQLFDEPVIAFARPLAMEKGDDCVTTGEEFGPVAPPAILGVGECNALRILSIPRVLGKSHLR